MSSFYSQHLRLAMVAGVAVMGLLLGGCGDDDDGGKKSGGGISFPRVPTARPTFTGQSPIINASGGDGSAGNDGGAGGEITLSTLAGRIVRDNRSRPSINANALEAAELDGASVDFTELSSLPAVQAQVVTSGSTLTIDLFGRDFHIPGGTTLDLSGAPGSISSIIIRANGAGDIIRIDGPVIGARSGFFSVSLYLVSVQATGTAICVDGNVDLSGAASAGALSGGDFQAVAFRGAVVARGTINTRGNSPTSDSGGAGGDVLLASDAGDIVIGSGILTATGGQGVDGGNGGEVNARSASTLMQRFDWPVRTFGGGGTAAGGVGGFIGIEVEGPLDMFMIFETFAGSVTSGGPSGAGNVSISGLTTQGVVTGNASGGRGGIGSNGGNVSVEGESVFGLAVEVTSDGGEGTTNGGGNGGRIDVYADGAWMVNVLVVGQARGGQGATNGGNGGGVRAGGYGEMRNVTVTADASGGLGVTGIGGNGGEFAFPQSGGYGECIVDCSFTATLNGGNGVAGGNGGVIGWFGGQVFISGGNRNSFSVNVTANGGNGTTANGGNGGQSQIGSPDMVRASIAFVFSANGGSTDMGNGTGSGGSVEFSFGTQSSLTLSGGPVSLVGGNNNGANGGGNGGTVNIQASDGSVMSINNITWNLTGGQSSGGRGGDADDNLGFSCACGGNLTITGGAINVNGGRGSLTSGSSPGGAGGYVNILNIIGHLNLGAAINVSGGLGAAAASGAAGGVVEVRNNGATLNVTGNILANGQNGTSGGVAGEIYVNGNSSGNTNITISSTLEANGGAGSTAGAAGGTIGIGSSFEVSATFTATAILRANGGGPSSNAGTIDIDLAGGGGTGITEVAGSLLETRNGAGTLVPGNILRNP